MKESVSPTRKRETVNIKRRRIERGKEASLMGKKGQKRRDREEVENLDHLFTPERMALIERAVAEIEAGHGLTLEQVDAELRRRRDEWLSGSQFKSP